MTAVSFLFSLGLVMLGWRPHVPPVSPSSGEWNGTRRDETGRDGTGRENDPMWDQGVSR
jgi:hypothetical protein